MEILANWIITALSILLVARFVPGFAVNSFMTALVVAIILGVINAFIKPVLLILTLPINIISLGLFTFVINAAILLFVAKFVSGFYINGFTPALFGAIILWLIGTLIHFVVFPSSKP